MPSSRSLTVVYLGGDEPRPEEESLFRRGAERRRADFRAASEDETLPASRAVLVGPAPVLERAAGRCPSASLVALREPGEGGPALGSVEERIAASLQRPVAPDAAEEALQRGESLNALLEELHALRGRVALQSHELRELNRIGVALSAERDTETLLTMILTKCREITSSDAGSLYLVEKKEGAEGVEGDYFADKILLFRLTQNDSVQVAFRESRMEISRRSLAGFAALTGERLIIEDAYAIPDDREYQFNRSFDRASGYRTRSLLITPMRNHKDELIGVLQLINRKGRREAILDGPEATEEHVVPFDDHAAELASSLASQAAVAIENARLYEEIQRLFEGFIRASVTAIESRDPTTSGHSERVAALTVDLAKKVDREDSGRYRDVRFTRDAVKEIHYAGLLHDFGKIGVKENVLLKGKKLYEHELRAIRDRFRIMRQALELECSKEKLRCLMERSREEALQACASTDSRLEDRLKELDRYLEVVVEANEPTVLKEEGSALLKVVASTVFEGSAGDGGPLLRTWELANLSIPRGSLSNEERSEIESHVTHTFQFLSTIPWTRELQQIPRIAGAHHEKLDGSGYPAGIDIQQIPLESRMMTISDIFDALTAKDRPYKRAIPPERALEILSAEVKEGKLDPDLFRIFVDARVFEVALSQPGR
jgi:HD-GYP domain-containing protein (c-di-GMP phosphodiesterase class II)